MAAATTRPRINAEPRTRIRKKSEIRQLRREGLIPAILFGHGEPQPIRIPLRDVQDYLRHHAAGGILDVEVDGSTTPALIRELERDPVTGQVIHLGFQRVDLRETVRITVPLAFTGEDVLTRNDLVLQRQMSELEVTGRADQLPESIPIDVSALEAGESVRIGDLPLPDGIQATKDADLPVASVTHPTIEAEVEEALEAEELEEAAAEMGTPEEQEEETETEEAAETA